MQSITKCKGRWSVGGSALSEVPGSDFESLVGDASDAELRLLGSVGHALRVCHRPSPPGAVEYLSKLPELDWPVLSESLRGYFRRALMHIGSSKPLQLDLVHLAAARGYVVHPADWLPTKRHEKLPEIYAPWVDWLASEQDDRAAEAPNTLTEETWANFMPAERCRLLVEMRKQDPDQARVLIASKAPGELAPHRLDLVQILETGLSQSDAEFVADLENDRSIKVALYAKKLQLRLGLLEESEQDIQELVDFLEVRKTKNKLEISPGSIRTQAQKDRRTDLFDKLPLSALLKALELSGIEALIEAWENPGKDTLINDDLCRMLANSGTDEEAHQLALAWADYPRVYSQWIGKLCDRLTSEQRRSVAIKAYQSRFLPDDDVTWLERAKLYAGPNLGCLPWKDIEGSAEFKTLLKNASQGSAGTSKKAMQATRAFEGQFAHLSLMCDQPAAEKIMTEVINCGLMEADPKLSILRFNLNLE